MREFIEELRQNISARFNQLTSKQKLALISSIVIFITMFSVIMLWANKPSYVVLYSGLSDKEASQIVNKLAEKGVDYEIDPSGSKIMVKQSEKYNVRLTLAQEGLPETQGMGYELFDQVNIGMTEFIQKINYRRALQTELERTIKTMDGVSNAKVQIVIPERTLFLEDERPTTASVLLSLRRSYALNNNQVQGIVYLVSSAVEGLNANNVSIIDRSGRILSKKVDENSVYSASANQFEIKKSIESYLSEKAQSMLNEVVGVGNAKVIVDAELDFTKVDKRVESFDPESQVVRSEEIKEDESSQLNQTNQPNANNKRINQVSNYEINRTIETIIGESGRLKRLTASVILNDRPVNKPNANGNRELVYEKWTKERLDEFEKLVQSAIGLNIQRGDVITVNNIPFDPVINPEPVEDPSYWREVLDGIGTKILILLAVFGSLLLVRSIINTVRDTQARIESERKKQLDEARKITEEEMDLLGEGEEKSEGKERLKAILEKSDELPEEVMMRQEIHQRISEYIQEKPAQAVSLLKTWLLDGEDDD